MKRLLTFLIFACLPMLALGQSTPTTGFHRVNQVLARANGSATAQVVPGATISVTSTATGAAATIYSDPGLTAIISPPVVTSDFNGNYSYYVALNYCVNETVSSPGQGTYTTDNICVNGGGGTLTNPLTMNNSNAGAASGSTFNGSAAVTLSANTLGAGSLANSNTWTAANLFTTTVAAGNSPCPSGTPSGNYCANGFVVPPLPTPVQTYNAVGDSVCAGVGTPNPGLEGFSAILANSTIGFGSVYNGCISGGTVSDALIGYLYGQASTPLGNAGPVSSSGDNSILWTVELGINNASRQTDSPAVETAYLQEYEDIVYSLGLSNGEFLNPQSSVITTSGTVTPTEYRSSTPSTYLAMTSAGSTVSFPITTDGNPILIQTLAQNADTGTQTVTIDGVLATDTITGLTTLPNTLFGGTPIVQSFGTSPAPMIQHYVVAAGTHSVVFTCVTVGTAGCGFFWAANHLVATPERFNGPQELLYGVIPTQGNTQPNVPIFNGLNNTAYLQALADGMNVKFVDVYQDFVTNNAMYMGSTEQVFAGGTQTLVSVTAGSTVATFATYLPSTRDVGKEIYIEGAGAAGATFYGYIQGPDGTGNTATVCASSTTTCTAPSTTVSGATAYIGWLKQVCPASQDPGLHPNKCGADELAKKGLTALQATTAGLYASKAVPRFMTGIPQLSGGIYNINLRNVISNTNTGQNVWPTMAVYVANVLGTGTGAESVWGIKAANNGTAIYTDIISPTQGGGVRINPAYNPAAVGTTARYTFTFGQANFLEPLGMFGEQVNSVDIGTTQWYIPNTANTDQNVIFTPTLTGSIINLPSQNSIIAVSVTTAGAGMTPGQLILNASAGSAQIDCTVSSPTTVQGCSIINPGGPYVTAPTFTWTSGSPPAVITGVIGTPVAGQRYSYKRSDALPNDTVTVMTNSGSLDGVTGATVPLANGDNLVVWYDGTKNGWFTESLFRASGEVTVSCSTSGTAMFAQPAKDQFNKTAKVFLNACLGTASYTFPIAFTNTPAIVTTNEIASTVVTALSTSAMTVTGATSTGFIVIEGW
jgi:hypothetical protein